MQVNKLLEEMSKNVCIENVELYPAKISKLLP